MKAELNSEGIALIMATARPEDEDSPLARAKAGDVAAFEQIMIRHERRVLLLALRLLGRTEDAKDAAQEVFLRVHKYLRRFDDSRQIEPWLYRVTVNVCRDMRRRRSAAGDMELADELAAASEEYDPAGGIARAQQKRIVAAGLERLPEKERAALVLRDIEGLSTREVARILGSSEATVRSQVSTARAKIKDFVGRYLKRHL